MGILVINKSYPLPADYNPGMNSEALNAFYAMKSAEESDGINLFIVLVLDSIILKRLFIAAIWLLTVKAVLILFQPDLGIRSIKAAWLWMLILLILLLKVQKRLLWLAEFL